MTTPVEGCHRGDIFNAVAGIEGSAAEIHILKPHRIEGFVHACQALPDVAADHEERACGLFDGTGLPEIAIQITIVPIDRVPLPHAINTEQFEGQRGGRRQTAHGKSNLRTA